MLLTAATLAVAAGVLALLPGTGPLPVNFAYTGNLREVQLDADLLVLSALLFVGAAADLWRRPVLPVIVTAATVFCVGVALFVLTFSVWAYTATAPDGSTIVVQVYPQALLPVVWGCVGLIFSPLAWWMGRHIVDPPPEAGLSWPR